MDLEYSFTPLEVTIYFRLMERCNTLAWKNPFGFACDELRAKVKCKNAESKKPFDTARNRLKQAGLIDYVNGGGRGYVTKYTIKGVQMLPLSVPFSAPLSDEKRSHIIKHKLNETRDINISFEQFWNDYDKKVGDRKKLEKKWDALKDEERAAIIEYLPRYKKSQPDKKYRKNPETFFNNRSWEDEIIEQNYSSNGANQQNNSSSRADKRDAGANQALDSFRSKAAALAAISAGTGGN